MKYNTSAVTMSAIPKETLAEVSRRFQNVYEVNMDLTQMEKAIVVDLARTPNLETASLVAVTGLPGSGKSTYAADLLLRGVVDVVLEAAALLVTDIGEYEHDRDLVAANHRRCQAEVFQLLEAGYKVCITNCCIRPSDLNPYVDFCDGAGIDLKVVEATGRFVSTKNISGDLMSKMIKTWYHYRPHLDTNRSSITYDVLLEDGSERKISIPYKGIPASSNECLVEGVKKAEAVYQLRILRIGSKRGDYEKTREELDAWL